MDNYGDQSELALLKEQTWKKRYKEGTQYNLTPRTEIKKIKLADLLAHKANKELLCRILACRLIQQLDSDHRQYIIAYDQIVHSNITGWSGFTHSQVEGDTLVICLVRELSRLRSEQSVRILSPDTDVLMLSLYLTTTGCTSRIEFELLNSKARRTIQVSTLAAHLGEMKIRALLSAYVVTGCDQIAKFSTISKDRAFKVLMSLDDDDVINKLAELGEDFNFSMTSDLGKAVSTYIMLLYAKRQDDRAHVEKMADIGDLRWRLYSKQQKEPENLPPTPSTLNRHVQRANYVLRLWKLSTVTLRPQLPPLKDHGWKIEEGRLGHIMTDELPAPEYCIEMAYCSCKATKCVKQYCTCRRNNLQCTDLCNCEDCENCEDLATDVQFEDEGTSDEEEER